MEAVVAAVKRNKPQLQLAVSGMRRGRGNKNMHGMKTGSGGGRVAPHDAAYQ